VQQLRRTRGPRKVSNHSSIGHSTNRCCCISFSYRMLVAVCVCRRRLSFTDWSIRTGTCVWW
jgi:hypothetical protein